MTVRILVVDDDPFVRRLFEGLFRGKAIETHFAAFGAEARRLYGETDYNLVVMDQCLPDANGFALVKEMRTQRPNQVAVLITGYADVRDAIQAVREGLFDYLTKPFHQIEELETVVDRALAFDAARREIEGLRRSLAGHDNEPVIIGRSPVISTVVDTITRVAPLDTTVLIEGESGTGKELLARLIHIRSARNGARFLAINCGALPESLLEATLFGFDKGAFTGAQRTTPGYFEEADGGTLFLDEVAEMSPRLQVSLLRVLQERVFVRLGSTQARNSRFRLVCATNRPLAEEVKAGRFRSDLFYRVNVVALRTPSLRERREDIAMLANHFLATFNARFGKAVGPLTAEALAALEACSWHGDVRQLQNVIERVVALKVGGAVDTADLGALATADEKKEAAEVGLFDLPYHQAREVFEPDCSPGSTETCRRRRGAAASPGRIYTSDSSAGVLSPTHDGCHAFGTGAMPARTRSPRRTAAFCRTLSTGTIIAHDIPQPSKDGEVSCEKLT